MQKYERKGIEVEAFQFDGTEEQLKSNGVSYEPDENFDCFIVYNDYVVFKGYWIVTQDGFKTLETIPNYDFTRDYEPIDKYHNLHSAGMHLDAFYDDCIDHCDEIDVKHVRACLREIEQLIDGIEDEIE